MSRYADSKLRQAVLARTGHRGLFLAALGLFDVFFGITLLRDAGLAALADHLELTHLAWGWIWAGTGLFIAAGALARKDSVFFAVAVFLKTAWALEFVRLAFTTDIDQWAQAAYWCALALVVIVAAAWPEPPARIIAEDAVDRAQANADEDGE